jgi:putative intracellular protease/amidase
MTQRTVHLAVYDTLADWEYGHAVAQLRDSTYHRDPAGFDVVTVGATLDPATSMGGLRILPDLALADLSPADSALLLLPGASAWDSDPERLAPFARTARAFLDAGVPVAAICGATAGQAREGLLDDRDHTGPAADYLAATGYAGAARYREADAVTDGDLITASPTAPVAFAREVLGRLEVYTPEMLNAWYRLFAHSDPSAFAALGEGAA